MKLSGAPLSEVIAFFIKGVLNGAISTRATSISFHFFMAMLPATVFFQNLAPHIPLSGIDDASISILENLLPEYTSFSIKEEIKDFVQNSGGLKIFSIIIAFMFAMNGVNGVISAFNSSYHSIETRSWLQKRKISIVLVGILFVLVCTASSLIVWSKIFIQFLISHQITSKMSTIYLLQTGKWIIIFLLILMATSFTYYLAPADKKNWKFISSGSMIASVLTIISSLIFTFVMNRFGQFNQLFGQAGTLMVILLWIYFNSLALILGFEFNASVNYLIHHK
jgi:membrane protein